MDFRIISNRELDRPAGIGDVWASVRDAQREDDRATAPPDATEPYRELLPKLLKSSLPLAFLVALRYLLEYSGPIFIYLGWCMIYSNLLHDFAGYLVHHTSGNVYGLAREFLRSLLLLAMICLVLESSAFELSRVIELLLFTPHASIADDKALSHTIYVAIVVDAFVRSTALCFKIGLNILVPQLLLLQCRSLRKIWNCTGGFLRRSRCRLRSRYGTVENSVMETRAEIGVSPSLRRRSDAADFSQLEEGRGFHGVVDSSTEDRRLDEEQLFNSESNESTNLANFIYLKRLNIMYDRFLLVYRHAVPIRIWIIYFSAGPYSFFFIVLYTLMKSVGLIAKLASCAQAARSFIFQSFEHGQYATEADLAKLANHTCSICYDTFQRPVSLACHHMYCEHCILEWFQRENSCPICRKTFGGAVSPESSQESLSNFPVLL